MTLALFVVDDADPALGMRLHRVMVARPVFTRLDPPSDPGALTHLDVPRAGPPAVARAATFAWAQAAWEAWAHAHAVVDGWLRASGLHDG